MFSLVDAPFYIPINSIQAFVICRLFDNGHSDQCEVIAHGRFDLHFSNY